MTSRLIPAKLSGSPRRQDAAFNRLHRALERLEAKQLAEAEQTRTLLTDLRRYSAAELLAGDSGGARRMLKRVVHSHDDQAVDRAFDAFLETDPDQRQRHRLFGGATLPKPAPIAVAKPETPARPIASADAALAEAARIVRTAEDEAIEIDWSDNPATEKEAQLRLAIIRRIETEETARAARLGWTPELCVLPKLSRLEPSDGEYIGEDLYDAIERWKATSAEARKRRETIERKRLLDAARRDLDADPPA